MTFAEALNEQDVDAGLEDGALYVISGLTGDSVEEVGGWRIDQCNTGPDVRFDDRNQPCLTATKDHETARACKAGEQWVNV